MNDLLIADQELFIWLHNLRLAWLDPIMQALSNSLFWIPLYILLVFKILKSKGCSGLRIILVLLLTVGFTDYSTGKLKSNFKRLRPCHNEELVKSITLLNQCGGKYGFPSAHAANTMALAISVFLFFDRKLATMILIWSIAVGYSRIYLGVHYPLDVLVGFLWGTLLALVAFQVSKRWIKAD